MTFKKILFFVFFLSGWQQKQALLSKIKFIIPIIFIISFSFEAPKSRQSILLTYDGQVMPVGTLAALEILNYDILLQTTLVLTIMLVSTLHKA